MAGLLKLINCIIEPTVKSGFWIKLTHIFVFVKIIKDV